MLVDLDYFFAQCEELRNPTLKNKPVVVGVYSGRTEESGAVSTANYVARSYGVKSGMPLFLAKRRLEGIESVFLPVDYEYYETFSMELMQKLRTYADSFEQAGIDEAYLDITQRVNGDYDLAQELAQQLKSEIKGHNGISLSVGIGPNKLVAKIACDAWKPDGLAVITPREVAAFLDPLPVDRLLGVGRKTAIKMAAFGIKTIGDLARFDPQKLIDVFGKHLGVYFHNAAKGIDNEPVQEAEQAESVSRIATLKVNTRDLGLILDKTSQLASEIFVELMERNLRFKQVAIIAIMTDLSVRSRSKTLEQPSMDLEIINRIVRELFERFLAESVPAIRRVGVKVSGLLKKELSQKQLASFFADR